MRRGPASALALALSTLLVLAGCVQVGAPDRPPPRRPHANLDPSVIGRLLHHRVVSGDNFVSLARAYGVGYLELLAANPGVDPWLPAEGVRLLIPDAHLYPDEGREGIVINVAEQRLYWFSPEGPRTYAIGVARDGWNTPLGSTTVVRKQEAPTWFPPASARADDPTLASEVPPGPDNPLGTHALYLGWASYLIHGTNEPFGVGRRVSRGCVRLYPEDIVRLYPEVEVGTPVRVIDQAEKIAIVRGEVVLEAHPTLAQATQLDEAGSFDPEAMPASLRARLEALVEGTPHRIDWGLVESVAKRRRGVPIRVSAASHASLASVSSQSD
jgi:L,D-transpeptidase ErfK/SrfK